MIIAGGLVGSSFLLRPDALAAALAITMPALAFDFVRTRGVARPVLGAATLALAIILTGLLADTVRYRNEDWSEFRQFDAARGQLHGTPRLQIDDRIQPVLHEINWSWSDRAMFENFFFTNEDVFATESLQVLLDRRRSVVEPISFAEATKRTLRSFQPVWLVFAAVAVSSTIRRPRMAPIAFGWMAWALIIMTLLSVRLRLPNHVALPMLLGGCLGLLSLMKSLPANSPGAIRRTTEVAVATALAVAALGPVSNVLDAEARRQLNEADAANLAEAQRLAGDNGAVISLGAQVGLSSVSPLTAVPGGGSERPTVYLGWNSRTPEFSRHLRDIRVGDLDAALMDRNDLVLIATEREAAVYSSFLFEHFSAHGAFWPVGSVEEWSIVLYRGFAVAALGSGRIEVRRGDQSETYHIGEPAPGFLQAVQPGSMTPGVVRGWLGDESAAPADRILVFVDGQLAAVSIEQLTLEGAPPTLSFYIDMPPALLPHGAEVRVFGVWGRMARELGSEVSIDSDNA